MVYPLGNGHGKGTHLGIFLSPAEHLDGKHTVDLVLSVVGRDGKLMQESYTGGPVHKASTGLGYPTFISLDDLMDPANNWLTDGTPACPCSVPSRKCLLLHRRLTCTPLSCQALS